MAIFDPYEERRKNKANEFLQAFQLGASLFGKKETETDKLAKMMQMEKFAQMQRDKAAQDAWNARYGVGGSPYVPQPARGASGTLYPQTIGPSGGSYLSPQQGVSQDDLGKLILSGLNITPSGGSATYSLDKAAEKKAESLAESQMTSLNAKRKTAQTAETIASAARRLSDWWAKGYEEGGMGNLLREKWSDMAIRAGGEWGDKYQKTSAYPGLKTEFVARYMPLLTQQGEKDGSVRLVETVFRKIEETLPKKYSGLGAARNQIESSVENALGYAKAFEQAPLSKDEIDSMSEADFNSYFNTLTKIKERMVFSKEEKKIIDEAKRISVEPIIALQEKKAKNKDDSILKKLGLDSSRYEIVR